MTESETTTVRDLIEERVRREWQRRMTEAMRPLCNLIAHELSPRQSPLGFENLLRKSFHRILLNDGSNAGDNLATRLEQRIQRDVDERMAKIVGRALDSLAAAEVREQRR